jgi:hypothetical protein
LILIAGGESDPNITSILSRLKERNLAHVALRVGSECQPGIKWRLGDEFLTLDNKDIWPSAAFLRYDVFTYLRDGREESRQQASRWYYAIFSWVLANSHITFLNRGFGANHLVKPYVLRQAIEAGLRVPKTWITNDARCRSFANVEERWIVKPVDGGEYTRLLREIIDGRGSACRPLDAPSIVQQRLVAPDLRLYRIGNSWFAFMLRSDGIDYRARKNTEIDPVDVPYGIVEPLKRLMDELALDFGAADFKLCANTGDWMFLEVNSAPMFHAFDRVMSGSLIDAIIDWLTEGAGSIH